VSNRQLVFGIVGAALVVIGLLGLWFPVYLGQYDQYGMQIACGRGFSANLSQAAEAHGDGLVAQCGTALLLRRIWAVPSHLGGPGHSVGVSHRHRSARDLGAKHPSRRGKLTILGTQRQLDSPNCSAWTVYCRLRS